MSLLLTRALDDSKKLAAALAPHGIDCLISPMLRIEPTDQKHGVTTVDAVIATSRHAFMGQPPIDAPLYVVGKQTAELAQTLGWPKPRFVAQSCTELQSIFNFSSGSKLLYLRAENVTADLARMHTEYEWYEVVSYRAAAEPLSAEAHQALTAGRITHVALYSARTAKLFEEELIANDLTVSLTALCFSEAVADALILPFWRVKDCAESPSGDAMQELILLHHKRDAFAKETVIASHDD